MGGLITLKRGTGALELRLGGLGGPEFGEALAKVKQIPGKRWNPEAKVWELPDDTETLVRVVETMRPVLDAELKAEMMSAKGEIADDLVTRAGKDADLKVPWASQLWPFQRAGVDFMVKYGRTINADSMGLGKTIQSITAVEEFWLRDKPDTGRTGPVLVVCPNTLKDNWLKEITKGPNPEYFDVSLWPELTATIVDAKTPKERWPQVKAAADRGDYVIVNWEKLRLIPELSKIHWAGVIADEAHRAKNYKSAQSKALRKLRAAVQVAATGTPIMNSPDELWALLNWMEPKTYSSYWAFFHTYVESYSGYRGSHVITGVRNADSLRFELRNRLVRRVKTQVLEDFPEKLPEEIIEVDMVPAQRRAYVEAQHAFLFDIEAAMKDPDLDHTKKQNIIEALRSGDVAQVGRLVENAAARVSLMRQIATSPGLVDGAEDKSGKLDAIVETISDNAGKQFVVACWHKKTAELLVERLGRLKPAVDADFFHGDVSLDDRTKLVERFQAGNLQVLVLTIAAGGVGITLTAANTILFAEEDWVPANNRQMEDRLYRIGQKNDVSVVKFRSKNTVDTLDIAPANRLKELIEDAVYGEG